MLILVPLLVCFVIALVGITCVSGLALWIFAFSFLFSYFSMYFYFFHHWHSVWSFRMHLQQHPALISVWLCGFFIFLHETVFSIFFILCTEFTLSFCVNTELKWRLFARLNSKNAWKLLFEKKVNACKGWRSKKKRKYEATKQCSTYGMEIAYFNKRIRLTKSSVVCFFFRSKLWKCFLSAKCWKLRWFLSIFEIEFNR